MERPRIVSRDEWLAARKRLVYGGFKVLIVL